MAKIVIATDKPFDQAVRTDMVSAMERAGLEVVVLEKCGSKEKFLEQIVDAQGLIVRSDIIDQKVIDAASNLELIVRGGAGWESIDVPYAESNGIIVETTPGQNANAVAEQVIGMMYSQARNLVTADQTTKGGQFLANELAGYELQGKKLGIHGFGNVGRLVARKAASLGMDVYAYDVMLKDQQMAAEFGASLVSSPKEVYSGMDVVSIHIPLLETTKGSIDRNLMSLMNNRSILVNAARPNLVNYPDLAELLKERQGLRYACDIENAKFVEMHRAMINEFGDRILLTPKLGAQTPEANRNVGIAAADQVIAYFTKGQVINAVNNPLPQDMVQYANLAQNLGRFNKSFVTAPHSIEIICYGDKLNRHREHIGSYVLKGLFQNDLGSDLTPAEALAAARERSIEVIYREADPRVHSQGIDVRYINSRSSHEISGRIDEGEGLISRIGEFKTTIPTQRLDCVIVQYIDRSGIADEIGNKLTAHGYNKVNGGFRPGADSTRAMTFYQVAPNGNVTLGVADIVSNEIAGIRGVEKAIHINMK